MYIWVHPSSTVVPFNDPKIAIVNKETTRFGGTPFLDNPIYIYIYMFEMFQALFLEHMLRSHPLLPAQYTRLATFSAGARVSRARSRAFSATKDWQVMSSDDSTLHASHTYV